MSSWKYDRCLHSQAELDKNCRGKTILNNQPSALSMVASRSEKIYIFRFFQGSLESWKTGWPRPIEDVRKQASNFKAWKILTRSYARLDLLTSKPRKGHGHLHTTVRPIKRTILMLYWSTSRAQWDLHVLFRSLRIIDGSTSFSPCFESLVFASPSGTIDTASFFILLSEPHTKSITNSGDLVPRLAVVRLMAEELALGKSEQATWYNYYGSGPPNTLLSRRRLACVKHTNSGDQARGYRHRCQD